MENPASYILSAYSFIYEFSLDKLIDVGNQSKYGNPIPSFDEQLLIELCKEVEQILVKQNNVLEICGDVIIVGDIHGSLHDLLRILKFIHEQNASMKVLFLGDYVDRGNFSLECITILFALKISQPDRFYLIRGNHEFDSVCSTYGFKNEIMNYHNPKKLSAPAQLVKPQISKSSSSILKNFSQDQKQDEYYPFYNDSNCYRYTEMLYKSFIQAFSYMPISAKLNTTTFCIHGGLSPKFNHVDQLNSLIKRPIINTEDNLLLSDLVWSDPSHSSNQLFVENPRGRGYLFNRESVSNFLKANSLTRIIRGHQCIKKGIQKNFDGKCITVFSASSYDCKNSNSSSILQLFQADDTIKTQIFPSLERLEKCDAIYYKVQSRYSTECKSHAYFSLTHPKLISNVNDRSIIFTKNQRQIRSYMSENSIHSIRSQRSLSLVKPKFITNQRKSIISLQEKKSFASSQSFHCDCEDISSRCESEVTCED